MQSGSQIIIDYKDVVIKSKNPRTRAFITKNDSEVQGSFFHSKRSSIKRYTNKSRNRLAYVLRNYKKFNTLLTVTYKAPPKDCTTYKKHIQLLRTRILRKYKDTYGVWITEFQRRGAPHLHVVTNTKINNNWLLNAWRDIVKDKAIKAVTSEAIKNMAHLAIYLCKKISKTIPEIYQKIGRFWAQFGIKNKQVTTETEHLPKQLFLDLTRTVRKIHKVIIRDKKNFKFKRIKGHGISGFTVKDGAKPMRYLLRRYGLPAAFRDDNRIILYNGGA